jgi:hypothetical protein
MAVLTPGKGQWQYYSCWQGAPLSAAGVGCACVSSHHKDWTACRAVFPFLMPGELCKVEV